MVSYGGVLIAVVFGGLLAMLRGHSQRQVGSVLNDVDATRLADADDGDVVAVTGEVAVHRDGDANAKAPLSGRSAMVAAWQITERSEQGDENDLASLVLGNWNVLDAGYESASFRVDDGSCEVAVDLGSRDGLTASPFGDGAGSDEVVVDLPDLETVEQVSPTESASRRIETFVNQSDEIETQRGAASNAVDVGADHGERRFQEGLVRPGDEVFVVGRVERTAASAGRPTAEDAVLRPDTEPTVLSTQDESSIRRTARLGTATLVGGAVLFVGAIAGIAYQYGLA